MEWLFWYLVGAGIGVLLAAMFRVAIRAWTRRSLLRARTPQHDLMVEMMDLWLQQPNILATLNAAGYRNAEVIRLELGRYAPDTLQNAYDLVTSDRNVRRSISKFMHAKTGMSEKDCMSGLLQLRKEKKYSVTDQPDGSVKVRKTT